MASSEVALPRARLRVWERSRAAARTCRSAFSSWFTQSISWSSPNSSCPLSCSSIQGRGAVQAAYDVVPADQYGAGCPALTHWRRPVFVSSRIICAVTKWSGANCSATARSMKRQISD